MRCVLKQYKNMTSNTVHIGYYELVSEKIQKGTKTTKMVNAFLQIKLKDTIDFNL